MPIAIYRDAPHAISFEHRDVTSSDVIKSAAVEMQANAGKYIALKSATTGVGAIGGVGTAAFGAIVGNLASDAIALGASWLRSGNAHQFWTDYERDVAEIKEETGAISEFAESFSTASSFMLEYSADEARRQEGVRDTTANTVGSIAGNMFREISALVGTGVLGANGINAERALVYAGGTGLFETVNKGLGEYAENENLWSAALSGSTMGLATFGTNYLFMGKMGKAVEAFAASTANRSLGTLTDMAVPAVESALWNTSFQVSDALGSIVNGEEMSFSPAQTAVTFGLGAAFGFGGRVLSKGLGKSKKAAEDIASGSGRDQILNGVFHENISISETNNIVDQIVKEMRMAGASSDVDVYKVAKNMLEKKGKYNSVAMSSVINRLQNSVPYMTQKKDVDRLMRLDISTNNDFSGWMASSIDDYVDNKNMKNLFRTTEYLEGEEGFYTMTIYNGVGSVSKQSYDSIDIKDIQNAYSKDGKKLPIEKESGSVQSGELDDTQKRIVNQRIGVFESLGG